MLATWRNTDVHHHPRRPRTMNLDLQENHRLQHHQKSLLGRRGPRPESGRKFGRKLRPPLLGRRRPLWNHRHPKLSLIHI